MKVIVGIEFSFLIRVRVAVDRRKREADVYGEAGSFHVVCRLLKDHMASVTITPETITNIASKVSNIVS